MKEGATEERRNRDEPGVVDGHRFLTSGEGTGLLGNGSVGGDGSHGGDYIWVLDGCVVWSTLITSHTGMEAWFIQNRRRKVRPVVVEDAEVVDMAVETLVSSAEERFKTRREVERTIMPTRARHVRLNR
ncbi:hypothetical protein E3N88_37771 [Mikania micrantha]|uniref:Uncharacterized protein n=1 Tax=Mikania micrantha TaxID=192012 RepID=A0A5N6LS43_9ASTR|nr:hypothetical protein E3N88_37771 [Mikania micrantha]